ncbi:protein of unknown function [Moritella yayanosii]|uniref:Uncharacterized protein n=1 Tax=Moritella yayanosii TaxID=69539 RepID=A0A330LP88_9GAMM|nr:protein of unknown function [Moritella yayanosii]
MIAPSSAFARPNAESSPIWTPAENTDAEAVANASAIAELRVKVTLELRFITKILLLLLGMRRC